MGIISSYAYKNIFVTNEETKQLDVYMNSVSIDKGLFKMESNKRTIDNIFIYAGVLSQNNFIGLIDSIRLCTDKDTCISFVPDIIDEETPVDAYNRYIKSYRTKNPNDEVHFPDNIFINQTVVEADNLEEKYIKNNLLKK